MPILDTKRKITKEEKAELIKVVEPLYQSIVITNEDLKRFAEAAFQARRLYEEKAERIIGVTQEAFKAQARIANIFFEIGNRLAESPILNLVIQISRSIDYQSRILIQPVTQYSSEKILPAPARKQTFELTEVNIKESGFNINGQYDIVGMTNRSQPGKLFSLAIRNDTQGNLPDRLIYSILGIRQGDYPALGIVFRDLKKILAKNKLRLTMRRNRNTKQYRVDNITKYIRVPRNRKKANKKTKSK